MSKKYILHQDGCPEVQSAKIMATTLHQHAYHDSHKMFVAFLESMPLSVLSTIVAKMAMPETMSAQESMEMSIAVGGGVSSAYLGRVIYEGRDKLQFMRESFNLASRSFGEKTKKLMVNVKNTLEEDRPSIPEMLSFRKFPVRTGLATFFVGVGAVVPEGQMAMLSLGTMFFLQAVMVDEQTRTKDVSNKVSRAGQYLDVVKNHC